MAKPKYTIRKYEGDDHYSWALFKDGYPIMTGMSMAEARWRRDALIKESNKVDKQEQNAQ